MTIITLTNDFHGTHVNLRVDVNEDGQARLSENQVKRARRELCCPGCGCSGYVGYRGYQHDVSEIEPSILHDSQGHETVEAWVTLRGY